MFNRVCEKLIHKMANTFRIETNQSKNRAVPDDVCIPNSLLKERFLNGWKSLGGPSWSRHPVIPIMIHFLMLHGELCKFSFYYYYFFFFFIQFARSVFLCVCFSVLIGKTMDRNPDFCLCTSGNHGGKYIFEALSYVLEDGRQQVFAFIQKRSMFRQVAGNQVRGKAHYQSDVI